MAARSNQVTAWPQSPQSPPQSEETNRNQHEGNYDVSMTTAQNVKEDIMGEDLVKRGGWRGFFFSNDPWREETYVRTSKGYNMTTSIVFFVAYWGLVVYFVITSIILWMTAEPSEQLSMVDARSLAPITVTISLRCATEKGCYSLHSSPTAAMWSDPNNFRGVEVIGSYAGATSASTSVASVSNSEGQKVACGTGLDFKEVVKTPYAEANITFQTCYSALQSSGVTLLVPFNTSYAQGMETNLQVQLYGSDVYPNDMQFTMDVEPSQRKTVYLSQTYVVPAHDAAYSEPYVADQFYNGHFGTSNNATLMFKLQQYAYKRATIPSSIGVSSLIGILGGVAMSVLSILGLVRGLYLASIVAHQRALVASKASGKSTVIAGLGFIAHFIVALVGAMFCDLSC